MEHAYLFDALRTPRGKGVPDRDGKPGGALAGTAPHKLVVQLVDALDQRHDGAICRQTERLFLGCVGQIGAQGGHIALVSRLASRLPDTVTAKTVNNYCVSGLSTIIEAALRAEGREDGLTLAGGVESLSHVPFLADKADYYTQPELQAALQWAPPVMGAELIASLEGYTKEDLDALTLMSHQRAAAAWEAGHYRQGVIPVRGRNGAIILEQDELVRRDLDMAALHAKTPAFATMGEKQGFDAMMRAACPQVKQITHVHSIANCPGMADGAALVIAGSREAGARAGLKPRARIVSVAEVAADPVMQFTGGFAAMESALANAGMTLASLDLIEFMEAFAAIPVKFHRDFKPDPDKVNINGGHLAMGHPMGATGAILTTTLLNALEQRDASTGMVVAHAGGGIGAAMIIERDG